VKQLVEKEIARLQKEVEALKGGTAATGEEGTGEETTAAAPVEVPPVTGPIAGRPLALVRDERGLNFLQQTAKQVKAWARQNAEGGEMPGELRGAMEKANQLITGNKDSKLTLAEDFLDARPWAIFWGSPEAMLDDRIPQQRDFLAAENAAHTAVVKESPTYFDPKKPEGQLVNRILTVYPWMRGMRGNRGKKGSGQGQDRVRQRSGKGQARASPWIAIL
jgi:hypothetical protein